MAESRYPKANITSVFMQGLAVGMMITNSKSSTLKSKCKVKVKQSTNLNQMEI